MWLSRDAGNSSRVEEIGTTTVYSVSVNGEQRDRFRRSRFRQRIFAFFSILIVCFSASLTCLEFLLPRIKLEIPLPLCYAVPDNIVIKPNLTSKPWEGWGVSLGWWAYWAGSLPPKNRTVLLDSIFSSEKGLGITICRYNIGGGGKSLNDTKFQNPPLLYRALPGFKNLETSDYNFSQDLYQRSIIFAAKGRGVKFLEAYSYSPPAWMTVSGEFTGANGYKVDNLDPSNYSAYAAYIADVVKAYDDLWGVKFNTISPVNEPVEGWWVNGGNQEGCNFAAESLDNFLPFVKQAFMVRGLNTSIAAFDSWISNVPKAYSKFSSLTRSVISRLNVHTYQPINQMSYKDSIALRQAVVTLAKSEKKDVHVSEWGPQYLKGSEFDVALIMGRIMNMDVNVLGALSWSYWQAVESYVGEPYWGLLYTSEMDPFPREIYFRKQYYIMMQFSKWIVPGSRIIRTHWSCNAGLLAVYQSKVKRIVLVVTNEYTREFLRTFNFRGFYPANGTTVQVDIYRTSENEEHVYVGKVENLVLPGLFTRRIYRKSTTTYIFFGVTTQPPRRNQTVH